MFDIVLARVLTGIKRAIIPNPERIIFLSCHGIPFYNFSMQVKEKAVPRQGSKRYS
jgi:hypothetical protein